MENRYWENRNKIDNRKMIITNKEQIVNDRSNTKTI